ncbi:MAG: DUF5667 domain-containing protein [Patescibacteria group bacterium]
MAKTKFLFLLSILVLILLLPLSNVQAEEQTTDDQDTMAQELNLGVSKPGFLPSNPLYFIKDWWRGIKLGLTFNQEKKEELRLKQANEILLEIDTLFNQPVDQKTQEKVSQMLDKYQEQSAKFKTKAEELKSNEKIQKLIEQNAAWEIRRQYLLKKLENRSELKQEIKDKVRETVRSSLGDLASELSFLEDQEKIEATLNSAIDYVQTAQLIFSLDFLDQLRTELPAAAQGVVSNTRQRTVGTLRRRLVDLDKITRDNLLLEFNSLNPSEPIRSEVQATANQAENISNFILQTKKNNITVEKKTVDQAIEETMRLFDQSSNSNQQIQPVINPESESVDY